jgi:hypothetical protein
MYFGIASNDDMKQPDAKDKLKEAFNLRRYLIQPSVKLDRECHGPTDPGNARSMEDTAYMVSSNT